MNIDELVSTVREKNEKSFRDISDKQAAAVARALLREIRDQITGLEEGKVFIPQLGKFIVKSVKRKDADEELTVKRILFRYSPTKKAKA